MDMDMDMSNVNNCFPYNIHPLNLSSTAVRSNNKPKKKRTKILRITTSDVSDTPKPKTTRRPDPTAPKITKPCTECGKKFWSWKALFGHMRCHPERQWRGINPPPHFRPPPEIGTSSGVAEEDYSIMTEEDHEVAASLLILANGPKKWPMLEYPNPGMDVDRGMPEYSNPGMDIDLGIPEYSNSCRDVDTNAVDGAGTSSCRFECSCCKKVFGSHQALGGHRASHKNVKGCYANTKKEEEEEGCTIGTEMNNSGHKCSVCLRVFPSGQALGGHKRCHLEKMEEMVSASLFGSRVCGLDLNFPATPLVDSDYASASYSVSLPALDLRLGL